MILMKEEVCMSNIKDEAMKEKIKSRILLGVKLPIGNEPIKKDT